MQALLVSRDTRIHTMSSLEPKQNQQAGDALTLMRCNNTPTLANQRVGNDAR